MSHQRVNCHHGPDPSIRVAPDGREIGPPAASSGQILVFKTCASTGSPQFYPATTMSQHPSLKGSGAIKAKRSVLKRFERVELMKKRGQFKPGQNVIGLPKTKPED
jgi:small basic protein (TIGR04137 family)